MEKCLECNSILTKEETVCIQCGSAVHREDTKKSLPAHFATVVNVLLIVSALLTVTSLFFRTLSFSRCILATLVLGIVKSSANRVLEKKKE